MTLFIKFMMSFGFCLVFLTEAKAWTAVEKREHYRISGQTPAQLYASIGENGPKLSLGRVIAHTKFKLTWQRDYQKRGEDCVLASAIPKLIITYTLPEPAARLEGESKDRWTRFYDGIAAHERQHGQFMIDLTRQIEAVSVGLSVKGDPDCQKTRAQLQTLLKPIAEAHQARHAQFDQMEMSPGGVVHQLILDFLNP